MPAQPYMDRPVYQYEVAIKTVPGVLVRLFLGWREVESLSATGDERERWEASIYASG